MKKVLIGFSIFVGLIFLSFIIFIINFLLPINRFENKRIVIKKGQTFTEVYKDFISSKNTILFFDGLESNDGTIAEYTHMIIQFTESDGTVVTRVLSRTKDDKLGSDNSQNIINATAFIKVKQIEMSDNK